MAEEISIALSNIQNIKIVNIQGVGVFKVRRLGPGEEYDLSSKRRRLVKIANEMKEIKSLIDALEGESAKEEEALKHIDKLDALSEEIVGIQKYELEVYKKCFTDDDNGKKTNDLINMLTSEERLKLYGEIFDKKDNQGESKDSNEKN